MGILDGYQFDPSTYGGILSSLFSPYNIPLQNPQFGPSPFGQPNAQLPPTSTPTSGGGGVTLAQQDASGFGRDGGTDTLSGLLSGLGTGVGSLFGGGQAQAAPMQQAAPAAPQAAGPD